MIYGIGIDIVKTDRIKAVVEKWGDRFLRRIFTDDEIRYSFTKKRPYVSLSARFAAKEALIKSLDINFHVSMREIEIRNKENGLPFITVSGRLRDFFDDNSIKYAHVSLSHEKEYAVACVVLEK